MFNFVALIEARHLSVKVLSFHVLGVFNLLHVQFIAVYTDKAPSEMPCRCRRISWLHLEVAV